MYNPFQIVREFERAVAEYAGSPHGVAVNSCTNALLLACKYCNVTVVTLPARTYVGVAYSVINAGGSVVFEDCEWRGAYRLNPYPIVDSARRFRRGMYIPGTLYCCSFHWYKHLPIGQGGMILTDSELAADWLRAARFDGRGEGVPPREDLFCTPGYHCYMTPEQAARGLVLMRNVPDDNPDLPETEYPDLRENFVWRER